MSTPIIYGSNWFNLAAFGLTKKNIFWTSGPHEKQEENEKNILPIYSLVVCLLMWKENTKDSKKENSAQ